VILHFGGSAYRRKILPYSRYQKIFHCHERLVVEKILLSKIVDYHNMRESVNHNLVANAGGANLATRFSQPCGGLIYDGYCQTRWVREGIKE
jgi:hypothetical protein